MYAISQVTPLLVTGADSRIGRFLRAAWSVAPPPDVRVIWASRHQGPWQDLLAGPLDPCRSGTIVLHLAADLSEAPQAAARSLVIDAAVATAARQGHARLLIYASSMSVYVPTSADMAESAACGPVSAYGKMKWAGEGVVRKIAAHLPVTCLRIGNVVGADALIGAADHARRVWLDPVAGHKGGPVRSWIAPAEFARVVGHLVRCAVSGLRLPDVLNVASPGGFPMAALLQAAGLAWEYGPARPTTRARVTMSTDALARLMPLPPMSPAMMIDDWRNTRALAGAQ